MDTDNKRYKDEKKNNNNKNNANNNSMHRPMHSISCLISMELLSFPLFINSRHLSFLSLIKRLLFISSIPPSSCPLPPLSSIKRLLFISSFVQSFCHLSALSRIKRLLFVDFCFARRQNSRRYSNRRHVSGSQRRAGETLCGAERRWDTGWLVDS